jgi:hypothetical protein
MSSFDRYVWLNQGRFLKDSYWYRLRCKIVGEWASALSNSSNTTSDSVIIESWETGSETHVFIEEGTLRADSGACAWWLWVVLAELAWRSELTGSTNFVKGVSIDAWGAWGSWTWAAGTVGSTLLALSSYVSESSGAWSNTLIGVNHTWVTDTDSIAWVGSSGAGSNTGSTDKVESSNTWSTDGGTWVAGIARIWAVVTDTINWNSLRIGTSGTELKTAASFTLRVASDTEASIVISELVGWACFNTKSSTFVVSGSTVDAIGAWSSASVTFWVTGNADSSWVSEKVGWTGLNTETVVGETFSSRAGGTVLRIDLTSQAVRVASDTSVDGGFVKTFSTVKGTDSSDHDVGALIIASTIIKNLSSGAASAGSVRSETSSTAVSTVLTSSVDGVGSNRARSKALEVEEWATAWGTGSTFGRMFYTGSTWKIAINASSWVVCSNWSCRASVVTETVVGKSSRSADEADVGSSAANASSWAGCAKESILIESWSTSVDTSVSLKEKRFYTSQAVSWRVAGSTSIDARNALPEVIDEISSGANAESIDKSEVSLAAECLGQTDAWNRVVGTLVAITDRWGSEVGTIGAFAWSVSVAGSWNNALVASAVWGAVSASAWARSTFSVVIPVSSSAEAFWLR